MILNGDTVELTGSGWEEMRGQVHRIAKVEPDIAGGFSWVWLEGDDGPWAVSDGFEVRKVTSADDNR